MKSLFLFIAMIGVSLSSFGQVTVNYPDNNSKVVPPINLNATANWCNAQPVVVMGYSFDGSSDVSLFNQESIDTTINTSLRGPHTLHVKSWGAEGSFCVDSLSINIQSLALDYVPSTAISVPGIQALSNWKGANDTGVGSGTSSGTMSVVSTPSISGSARQFNTTYTNYGGERYWVSFTDDLQATNFLYDGWVYLTSNTGVANVEMDLNQVLSNGWTVIYGFQCDGYSSTWDYTENAGTPTKPIDKWIHSSQACNPKNWSLNTWHHIQIWYSRDTQGNVTYNAVWFDDVEQDIKQTVPSAFDLGWGSVLLTNFQLDGAGTTGSSTIYLDKLTLYRW